MTWTSEKPTVVPITRKTRTVQQVLNRLLDKIEPVPECGCWLWTGATKGEDEYGKVYIGNKSYPAHRLLYEILKGEVPKGLVLDHLCRVRICVNPEHLEVVTSRENTMRGNAPGIQIQRVGICKNGHERTGDNMRTYRGRSFCRSCERERSTRRRNGN